MKHYNYIKEKPKAMLKLIIMSFVIFFIMFKINEESS